jgi:ribosome modulation factor
MKLTDIDFKQIQLEGLNAFFEGQELDNCPYRPDSLAESHWIMGWQEGFYKDENYSQILEESYDNEDHFFLRYGWIEDSDVIEEAVYQGKTVPLRKVMRGDTKRHKVYVNSGKKDAQGRVKAKKVEFGSPHKGPGSNLRVRKGSAARRKSFAARHHCKTAKDPKTARYWSCRAPSSKAKGKYW